MAYLRLHPIDAIKNSLQRSSHHTLFHRAGMLPVQKDAAEERDAKQQWDFEDAERPRSAASSVSPPLFACSSFTARAGWLVRCVSPESGIKSDVAIQ